MNRRNRIKLTKTGVFLLSGKEKNGLLRRSGSMPSANDRMATGSWRLGSRTVTAKVASE